MAQRHDKLDTQASGSIGTSRLSHDRAHMKPSRGGRHSSTAQSSRGRRARSSLDKELFTLPVGRDGILITRRNFLYGVAAVGAVAAIGAGAKVVTETIDDASKDLNILSVPQSAVTQSTSLDEVAAASCVYLKAYNDLPYGSLIWADNQTVAACLLPTGDVSPLTRIGIMYLNSASVSTVLRSAIGSEEGFEIYDVRASEKGIIWTEANILAGVWRIYTATLDDGSIGEPALAEEGDRNWRTPTIAAVGRYGFYQVMPNLDGNFPKADSVLRKVVLGQTDPKDVLTSSGRMATAIYPLADSVVVTPRTDTNSVHYQLTLLDIETDAVLDHMTLPTGMRPLEAGYGNHGFEFSFDAIYNYGDGISNLGTYTPKRPVTDSNYSDAPWFAFIRTPTAPPCWCGRYFIVKSTTATCGVDMEANTYFVISVPEGASDYGDYLASTGQGNLFVTYSNIDYQPIEGSAVKTCQVRVWEVL